VTQREKKLSLAVAAVGVLWAGSTGLSRYRAAVERNTALRLEAAEALDDAEFAVARGERARRRLQDYKARSLPTDPDVAESLYQDWLRHQLADAGLKITKLADSVPRSRSNHYGELSVAVEASGTLAQLADFLYRFYTAPHLHRLSAATIVADKDGGNLTATFSVDALILADAPRVDALADGPRQTLPHSLEDFRKRLMDRNLFAAYQGKSNESGSNDGEVAGARLTGMTYGERGWRLDVKLKSDEVQHFFQGDSISVGRFQGAVVELDGRRVVIETPAGRVELRLGQNLGEAKPVAAAVGA